MSRTLPTLLLLLAALPATATSVRVPRAPAPAVDGTIDADEWRDASRLALEGGGHALVQHDGTFLYVALVSPRGGIGSLCTLSGAGVRILHASAALGTAEFVPNGHRWQPTREFRWTNRDTGTSPAAVAERKTFLDAEGWFANSARTATTTREFQIAISGRGPLPAVLAFLSFEGPGDQRMHVWPAGTTDACADANLAGGRTEGAYSFAPSSWGTLELE